MLKPKSILVPVDFSEHSEVALGFAIELAKLFEARVYVLHVVHVIAENLAHCIDDYCLSEELIKQMAASKASQISDEYSVTQTMVKNVEDESLRKAEERMKELLDKGSGSAEVKVMTVVKSGEPVQGILAEQKDKAIDFIVMPAYGKSGLKEVLLGSTVQEVAKRASCSVAVIKGS